MYKVCTFGLGHNHGGTALMIENEFNPNCCWTEYYTAVQHDEAIKAAVETALARGDDKSIEEIQGKRHFIEVLDPSAIKANPEAWGGMGDGFLNLLSNLAATSSSISEAACLVMAATAAKIADDKQ